MVVRLWVESESACERLREAGRARATPRALIPTPPLHFSHLRALTDRGGGLRPPRPTARKTALPTSQVARTAAPATASTVRPEGAAYRPAPPARPSRAAADAAAATARPVGLDPRNWVTAAAAVAAVLPPTPYTSLLGGMWSPTTRPRRDPQWWHPSRRNRRTSSPLDVPWAYAEPGAGRLSTAHAPGRTRSEGSRVRYRPPMALNRVTPRAASRRTSRRRQSGGGGAGGGGPPVRAARAAIACRALSEAWPARADAMPTPRQPAAEASRGVAQDRRRP